MDDKGLTLPLWAHLDDGSTCTSLCVDGHAGHSWVCACEWGFRDTQGCPGLPQQCPHGRLWELSTPDSSSRRRVAGGISVASVGGPWH